MPSHSETHTKPSIDSDPAKPFPSLASTKPSSPFRAAMMASLLTVLPAGCGSASTSVHSTVQTGPDGHMQTMQCINGKCQCSIDGREVPCPQ